MTLRTITFTLIVVTATFATTAQNTNFRDEYLKRYDPQGYSNLKYAEGITAQGASLANALSSNLRNYQNLIESSDPNEILADFNAKMQQIEQLEDDYIQQSNSFAFEQGQQLGNSISAGDEQSAFFGAVGLIGALNKSSQAKKDLAAKKAKLKKQRIAAMSKVYYKAEEFNNNMIDQYLKRAAYAELSEDEKYNLAFVEHLKCYGKSMDRNWSSTNTYWLQNNCAKPRKPSSTGIENKFVGRDVQLSKVAKHKYELYEETGNELFKEAAIAYAADAVKTNPNAANYFLLGKYYKDQSSILAMTCMLAAKETDRDIFSGSKQRLFEEIEEETGREIWSALANNKVDYIRAFIDAGLHRTVEVSFDSFFEYIIKMDKPDPLQLYLNKEFEGLSQAEIDKRLKGVIMLCAVHNSDACLQRFIDLGTETDFVLDGETPLQAADRSMSPDAYRVLSGGKALEIDDDVSLGSLSTSKILLLAQTQPKLAAQHIDASKDGREKSQAIRKATYEVDNALGCATFLAHSKEAQRLLQENPAWMQDVISGFQTTATSSNSEDASVAAEFITSGLLKFNRVPNRADVKRMFNQQVQKRNQKRLAEWQKNVNELEKVAKAGEDNYQGKMTTGLMLDILLTHAESALEKHEKSEFYTTESMQAMSKNVDDIRRLKAKSASFSGKDVRDVHCRMYGVVAYDVQNMYAKYAKKIGELLISKYGTTSTVSDEQMLEYIIRKMRVSVQQGEIPQTSLDWYEGLKGKPLPAGVERAYVSYAIFDGKKVPIELLKPLTEDNGSVVEKPKKPRLYSDLELSGYDSLNLALDAFHDDRPSLFKAFDQAFDLSKTTTGDQTLFEAMLKTHEFEKEDELARGDLGAYFSSDFDYTKPIDGDYPLAIYLRATDGYDYDETWNLGAYNYPLFFRYLKAVEKYTGRSMVNHPMNRNGETVLHLFVRLLMEEKYPYRTADAFLAELKSADVDLSVKNNAGQTAFDLYEANKRDIKRAIAESYYDRREKEFRKSVEAFLEP